MAEASSFLATKRYAVVTGANKGIGLETCRQLASNGIYVVLTARDERRGTEAVEKLKKSGSISENFNVQFHQLDVTSPTSIASLADYIRFKFGKLDILVNNAGVAGALFDEDLFKDLIAQRGKEGRHIDYEKRMTQTYELSEQGLKTNYYGVKNVAEALLPLLQLSDSGRIVNVSSRLGQLKNIPGEWIRTVLNDIDNLTDERIDDLLDRFLEDFKEGSLIAKGWPSILPVYTVSKATLNSYTRLLARKYPSILINCLCPGFVRTDITFNTGDLSVEEGAESVVRLALSPTTDGPTGKFFYREQESSFEETIPTVFG